MAKQLTKKPTPLSGIQLVKLLSCVSVVVLLLLDNIKYQPLVNKLQPIFNATIYPLGLGQAWNMFVGDQNVTVAIRLRQTGKDGSVTYAYSNMGQKPYLWPNKQRNEEWGMLDVDHSGVYRTSYLSYLCRHNPKLSRIIYQAAFLPVPTPRSPGYDPFVDAPNFEDMTTLGCAS